jgi:hypothetical protein
VSNVTQQREEIPRSAWQESLELLTKEHEGDEVTIELVDESLGDQEESARLPLNFIEYDRKDDVVIVGVGGHSTRFPVILRHMIHHPQTIWVHPPAPALSRFVWIVDPEGIETLVQLHRRPELPG